MRQSLLLLGLACTLLMQPPIYEPLYEPYDVQKPLDFQGNTLFQPVIPHAYGPGLNSDGTGRSFYWMPEFGFWLGLDNTLQVQPNIYGPGIGMDQYGRPVRPECYGIMC